LRIVASISLLCLGLAGCVTVSTEPQPILRIPVTGQLSNGVAAAGQATAFNNGRGEFWVKIPGGARCAGDYAVRDPNPTMVVPVMCDNGRKGQAVIARRTDLVTGTAIVRLNDGTRGQFVFGNLTFEQAFGSGRARTF